MGPRAEGRISSQVGSTLPSGGTPRILTPTGNVKVFNLSSVVLPEGVISLACLGPKFVPYTQCDSETTKIDILNFTRSLLLAAEFHNTDYSDESLVTPISNYIPKKTKLDSLKALTEDLERFASDVSTFKRTEVRDNLTTAQRAGLSFLKSRDDLLYFRADKGGGVVFLDSIFYRDLVLEKLNSPNYEKLPRNVDYFTNLKLCSFTRKYSHILTKREKRAITGFDYKSTNIYALPKIHKSLLIKNKLKSCVGSCLWLGSPSDISVRVIFGGDRNPTVVLQDLVDKLLKPFVSLVKARVKDVHDFILFIPQFSDSDLPFILLCSVDVKDMYLSIEHDLGLEAISFWLERYPEKLPERFTKQFVLDALLFVLQNNTGYFNGEFYKQTRGTSTGIKPAPSYADLVMGYLEIKLFNMLKSDLGNKVAQYFWRHFRRFLDDGQIMWDTRICDFSLILQRLNCLHPSIQFTAETDNTKLVFLNVTIIKTKTGFITEIYNKDTDSDTYLPWFSSHPRHCRENIPFNLARSVRALTDDEGTVRIKLDQLQARLRRCDYPQGLVSTAMQNAMLLTKDDLRTTSKDESDSRVIAFVHQYDPSLPQLFPLVKEYTSRLHTSRELEPIFGDIRIIDSQREPSSLGRMLQHSKYDDPTLTVDDPGVSKCGNDCVLCDDILEVNSFYFRNADITYEIKTKMNCLVRNVIYVIQCKKCGFTYVGETVDLRRRMSEHRSGIKSWINASQEVHRHLWRCGMGFYVCPIFKMKQENKIARLVVESKLIELLKPDLNTDERNLLHLL